MSFLEKWLEQGVPALERIPYPDKVETDYAPTMTDRRKHERRILSHARKETSKIRDKEQYVHPAFFAEGLDALNGDYFPDYEDDKLQLIRELSNWIPGENWSEIIAGQEGAAFCGLIPSVERTYNTITALMSSLDALAAQNLGEYLRCRDMMMLYSGMSKDIATSDAKSNATRGVSKVTDGMFWSRYKDAMYRKLPDEPTVAQFEQAHGEVLKVHITDRGTIDGYGTKLKKIIFEAEFC